MSKRTFRVNLIVERSISYDVEVDAEDVWSARCAAATKAINLAQGDLEKVVRYGAPALELET